MASSLPHSGSAREPWSSGSPPSRAAHRIALIAPTASHPRFHRRASTLLQAGIDVTVYSFSRGYYGGNAFPAAVNVIPLGNIQNGKYLTRIPRLARSAFDIRRAERDHQLPASLFYTFGLDCALLALALRTAGVPIVYEVGDLRTARGKRLGTDLVLRELERLAVTRSDLLVTTSPYFVEQYFSSLSRDVASRSVVVENRIPQSYLVDWKRPSEVLTGKRPLRIGFVGFLRYPGTLLPLTDAVASRPGDFELHIHGDGPLAEELRTRADLKENIHFHGPFSNPQDLPGIYGALDLSYVVYDNSDLNVQLALPNKLYECPFFGVPLIVADGTALAHRVTSTGAGFVVNPRRQGFADALLDTLSIEAVNKAKADALAIPVQQLVADDTHLVADLTRLLSVADNLSAAMPPAEG